MRTGVTLATLVEEVKLEAKEQSSASSARDPYIKQLINREQRYLATKHRWPLRHDEIDVAITAGTKIYTFPSTMEISNIRSLSVAVSQDWYPMKHGIGDAQRSAYVDADQSWPPLRYEFQPDVGDSTYQFELWPVPAQSGTVRVHGQLKIADLVNDTDKCLIDADALVCRCASEILLTRDAAKAALLRNKAESRLKSIFTKMGPGIEGSFNHAGNRYSVSGGDYEDHAGGGGGSYGGVTLNVGTTTTIGILSFRSRAEAISAIIDVTYNEFQIVTASGIILLYQRDASGTALTTADGSTWSPKGMIFGDHFAENTNSTTDMATALKAAVDYAGDGGTVWLAPTTYKVNSPVVIPYDNFTLMMGGATIDATEIVLNLTQARPDAPFHAQGSQRAATTLTVDADEFDTTITVADASGMVVGDPLWMESDTELWYTEGLNTVLRQIHNRITGISGNVITLERPLTMSFDATGATPVVHGWNCIKNFRAFGGRFYGGGVRTNPSVNGQGSAAFFVEYTDYCEIHVDYIEGFQGYTILFSRSVDCHSTGGVMRGLLDTDPAEIEGQTGNFYGLWHSDCYGGSFTKCVGHRLRHMQDAGSAANVVLNQLWAYRCNRPPFGSHAGATDFTYSECYHEGEISGLEWRGHSVKVDNCTLIAKGGDAIGFYDTAGAAADIPKIIQITDSTIIGERNAIDLNGNIGEAILNSNVFKNTTTTAAFSPVEFNSLDMGEALVHGNTIETEFGQYAILAQTGSIRTRDWLQIEDNTLKGFTVGPVRIFSGSATTDAFIRENRIDTAAAVVTDTLGGTSILGPNYAPNGVVVGDQGVAWTPVITDGTNAVTATVEYATYVHDGPFIYVDFRLDVTSLGSASGPIKITGLPRPLGNYSNYAANGVCSHFATGLASGETVHMFADANTSEILLYANNAANSLSRLTAAQLSATGVLYGNFRYRV